MSARLLWIVLAVSLALNLSFVGAWGYSALIAKDSLGEALGRGGDPVAALADQLVLSPEQRDGLVALREKARERWKGQAGQGGSLRETLAASLAAPSFDRQAMEGMVSERMARRAGVVAESMAELHAYLQTLSDDQRQAFLEMAKQRGFLRSLFGRKRPGKQS